MSIDLVKVGESYCAEMESETMEVPETFVTRTAEVKWPEHVEIWGAMINPALGATMQKFLNETDENGNEI